jgi:hypothetical protein
VSETGRPRWIVGFLLASLASIAAFLAAEEYRATNAQLRDHQARIGAVEQGQARIEAKLDNVLKAQERIEEKLDRALERRRK